MVCLIRHLPSGEALLGIRRHGQFAQTHVPTANTARVRHSPLRVLVLRKIATSEFSFEKGFHFWVSISELREFSRVLVRSRDAFCQEICPRFEYVYCGKDRKSRKSAETPVFDTPYQQSINFDQPTTISDYIVQDHHRGNRINIVTRFHSSLRYVNNGQSGSRG